MLIFEILKSECVSNSAVVKINWMKNDMFINHADSFILLLWKVISHSDDKKFNNIFNFKEGTLSEDYWTQVYSVKIE
jgi:hypothetical protein